MAEKDIIIVGGGIGGLSAAIHLAAAGRHVTLLEQNASVGGKMGEIREAGFRWDIGPSVITMRHVFEDLFTAAGRQMEDYLALLPVDPLTRSFYGDGTILDVTRDLPRMVEQIERLDERDIEGYLSFLAYTARLHRITGPTFIYNQPPSLRSVTQVSPLDALRIDGLRTMNQAIQHFVHSPHLRQLLGRFATYVGASPYRAPATLNVIAHVELNGGVWYPRGGVIEIARALSRLASELGVDIRTGCRVRSIDVQAGKVSAVTMEDGSTLPAQAVIANVDVATAYQQLLPSTAATRRRASRLMELEASCSGFVLLLGVEGTHPELAHHNIFFSSNYPREFDNIFRQGIPPDAPTVYLTITSKEDPDHAPVGCENWFVLTNAPPLGPNWDWSSNASAYRDRVLEQLATFGFDIRAQIRAEQVITPLDLERVTGARRGALYGTSSNSRFAAFRRPHNRAADIQGLYFAGGTAHPGGGVPMVVLSGRTAARLLLQDRF